MNIGRKWYIVHERYKNINRYVVITIPKGGKSIIRGKDFKTREEAVSEVLNSVRVEQWLAV